MKRKQFTIPVFIPMEACPFRCIFCDQRLISGTKALPPVERVGEIIREHLFTIPAEARVELGFFGGTFTGLPREIQRDYLEVAQEFIRQGHIRAIRLSTRPDQIRKENLDMLAEYHVETIELGAQSMCNEVLRRSGRGHTSQETVQAAALIKSSGFRLGLQMMTGLPGDSREKSLETARQFVRLGAGDVRIYPTVVIRGTPLEKLFRQGKYRPQDLQEAVTLVAEITQVFEAAGVNIIRTGLHPSEGLLDGTDLIAGPFHVSFRELVMTEVWFQKLKLITIPPGAEILAITIPEGQLNFAVGYRAVNKKFLEKQCRRVKFKTDVRLKKQEFYVDYH
ncbi:MAG: elongator complex protein 3 [Bacteroidales bacterium]